MCPTSEGRAPEDNVDISASGKAGRKKGSDLHTEKQEAEIQPNTIKQRDPNSKLENRSVELHFTWKDESNPDKEQ